MILLLSILGCHRCDPTAVDFTPLAGDWPTSTPAAQGLDPTLVGELYCEAEKQDTLYGLLVVKDGQLVAERYYHEGGVDQLSTRQSVTKSFTSALMGLAVEQGCLAGIDETMFSFFPEYVDAVDDPRKLDITIEDMLRMRSGYPWEETDAALWDAVLTGDYLHLMVDFPLTADPGTIHQYSNLTSHWLGVIVARACETDLWTYAQTNLFDPIGAEVGGWIQDADGYYMGAFWLEVTARDMARFGQLYLDGGVWDGAQVVPADWVEASLRRQADPTGTLTPGPEFEDWGYGYQWWSAHAGAQDVDFAWGHGGNFIFLVEEQDLMVVVTADPHIGDHSDRAWRQEKSHLNMVGAFLASLEDG
ncbi:MAG: serine hydrolase [Alphaproteobacteria bacterium]|nr:serine hydrolase [Alphaproteobacteria bacterium]